MSTARNEHALERARKVFSAISHAASHGEFCPTNAEIAERFGIPSTATVARSISILETMGLITVERGSNSRVVTICASGQSTAGRGESQHLADLDAFAELLADNATVVEAARLMNWSTREGHRALSRIRRALGAQAA